MRERGGDGGREDTMALVAVVANWSGKSFPRKETRFKGGRRVGGAQSLAERERDIGDPPIVAHASSPF